MTFSNCILNGQITGFGLTIADSVLETSLVLNTNEILYFDGQITVNCVLNKPFDTLSSAAHILLNTPFSLPSLSLSTGQIEFRAQSTITTLTLRVTLFTNNH